MARKAIGIAVLACVLVFGLAYFRGSMTNQGSERRAGGQVHSEAPGAAETGLSTSDGDRTRAVAARRPMPAAAPGSSPPGSIDDLLRRARKEDKAAAEEAFAKLKDCRRAPRNPSEIADRVAKENPSVQDGFRTVLERAYERCGSLTDEEVKSEMEATRLAALLGNNEARVRYFERGMPPLDPTDPASASRREAFAREANRLIDAAIADGSIEAMVARGRGYERGYLAELSQEKAYAYLYAATLTEAAQGRVLLPSTTLERFERLLNSTTIEEGRRDGERIFAECCSPGH